MDLEMVSKEGDYPSEPPVKVSSRSIVRNCVKTPPILQVTSWILGGHVGSLWTSHVSRLHLSSKSVPGILKDMEVPDGPGDGVIANGLTI